MSDTDPTDETPSPPSQLPDPPAQPPPSEDLVPPQTQSDPLDIRKQLHSAGRSLRSACKRSSHADVILGQGDRDPVSLLEASNEGRLKILLPIRFSRMLESSFAFFRGSAIIQAFDLKGTPASGIIVQSCGDCHLMNFGAFASPERHLIFDINDFDETLPAPFEWDLKRLAASFVLASRWRGFDADETAAVVERVSAGYREHIRKFASMDVLDVWYYQERVDDYLKNVVEDERTYKRVKKIAEQARKNTSESVFRKLTTEVDGLPRIVDQPPLIFHLDPSIADLNAEARAFFAAYRGTLPPDRQSLFDRFRLIDTVIKIVGVGSVGTRCLMSLFLADREDPLFLQIKEARPSVLEGYSSSTPYAHNGERVVVGQRLMQSSSDIFLGWSRIQHRGEFFDCYVRQLRDQKASVDLATMPFRSLFDYALICGKTLARAHARSGEAGRISGYVGNTPNFDRAVSRYALAYADQVERDYQAFRIATASGRLPIESQPSETEIAIR